MRKLFTLSVSILLAASSWAQTTGSDSKTTDGYQFKVVKENPITSIKNQASSGTCWSFSGIAFIESELIRMGKGHHDLADMYVVRRNYEDKAQKYVRLHGRLNFAEGGAFCDVVNTINEYGVVPEAEMRGINYNAGDTLHRHAEMSSALSGYLKAIIQNPNRKLSAAWFEGFKGILDAYMGKKPESFQYNGATYTPQSFAKSLGLNSDNYISLTSFTHHPFYTAFPIEVEDNWRWANSYNLPLDEMMQTMDYAIENGYTIAWASDVSEKGFSRNGIGVIPDEGSSDFVGSDQARWLGLSAGAKNDSIRRKIEEGPVKELTITQEMRQQAYDNYETTDDHGMQIFGIAKDVNGTKYYMVKNSWGLTGKYKGIWYVSEAFVRYKTMNFIIHKDALPKDIAKKLNLK
ncbi:aminopeptidase C [Dysgonomonas sp. PH5-45]|uniref:aminopeptidase C n=1 Tax=unclassified Dysgonomonas TaxID=2630389 RepID=UPI0024753199|nr:MULTISPECIES: C1 family peptidase [unclassified Dysgonomonas]MDH6353724.1 aminopeptidase C [Dysgonomonas sp. PH5-45]MDH6386627.1 aminopeptidase C [Dysgonomonas sp. PH5-37]